MVHMKVFELGNAMGDAPLELWNMRCIWRLMNVMEKGEIQAGNPEGVESLQLHGTFGGME